jgi:hypothetical protein
MIELSHGNDHKITYTLTNKDGSPKDLSSSLQLKYAISARPGGFPLIRFEMGEDPELTITDAVNGVVEIVLDKEVVNTLPARLYYHELWQENALGQSATLVSAKIKVNSQIIKE